MIVSAAVRIYDKRRDKTIIIPVHRHADAFQILKDFGYKKNEDYISDQDDQGFLDENYNFYNRLTARRMAFMAGQIKDTPYGELYSEDLW